MPTYLYCLLTPSDDAPPGDVAGVDGAPVRLATYTIRLNRR
jgi:hypothetical protein